MRPFYSEQWNDLFFSLLVSGNGTAGYEPNPTQQPIIEDFKAGTHRVQLVCGGERSGKSMTAAAAAGIDMGPRTSKGMKEAQRRYWVIGPDYRQARPEFLYIRNALDRGGFIKSESMPQGETQPWSLLTKWNTILETRSSSDEMKIASFTVHGIILAEAAQQTQGVLQRARGRVAETRGFILLVGTLEDSLPWYEDLLRKWSGPNTDGARSYSMPMWSNIDVFPGGKQDPEIKLLIDALPDDYVQRRYGAKAVRHADLVIPEFEFSTHVRDFDMEPDIPVELFIDPGKNAYAVGFCQHMGAFTRVLDCVYTRGEIAQTVIPRVMEHPLWEFVNRDPNTSVIDVAGTAETGTKSQVTLWREIAGLTLASKYHKMMDTINVVRFRLRLNPSLGEPLITFSNKMKTKVAPDGTALTMLSEFDLWRWGKYMPRANEKDEPIDNNNHAIKALGYKLLHKYGLEIAQKDRKGVHGVQRTAWVPGMRVGG